MIDYLMLRLILCYIICCGVSSCCVLSWYLLFARCCYITVLLFKNCPFIVFVIIVTIITLTTTNKGQFFNDNTVRYIMAKTVLYYAILLMLCLATFGYMLYDTCFVVIVVVICHSFSPGINRVKMLP